MNLLKPGQFITDLHNNRVNVNLIIFLIIIILLIFALLLFGFGGDFFQMIKETLKPIKELKGTERQWVMFKIVRDTLLFLFLLPIIAFASILLFTNWLVKKILGFFKKEITFLKLLNISIYSIFLNLLLVTIFLIILNTKFLLFIFLTVLKILGLLPKEISEIYTTIIILLLVSIINIFTLGIYIYGIKISVQNKLTSVK